MTMQPESPTPKVSGERRAALALLLRAALALLLLLRPAALLLSG